MMRKVKWASTTAMILVALSCAALAYAAAPSTAPLVANFDFESPSATAAWHEMPSKNAAPSVVKLDQDNPHSGKAALIFQTPASTSGSRFIFTGISLPSDHPQRVRVHFYARTAKLDAGDAEINLLERDKEKVLGWCGGKQALVKIDPTADWKEYAAEVDVKPEAQVLTLMIRINHPNAGKTVWVDDLSIEFVQSPTP